MERPVLRSQAAERDDLRRLCETWLATREFSLEPMAGGFSGSPLHLVRTAGAAHVLKAFAPGTSPGRARFVHALMRHLRERGVTEVPTLLEAPDGASFRADCEGRLWELQSFVAGQPLTNPSLQQVGVALAALARLHAAAARMPENPPDSGPSPGIVRRIEQARAWLARPWHVLRDAADGAVAGPLTTLIRQRLLAADELLETAGGGRIIAAIAVVEPRPLPRQAVLRDVWSAHVLFDPFARDHVTGIVDFHAAASDTPAVDVARLLGSWMTADATAPEWWAERLAAYAAAHPAAADGPLVRFLAATGILFGLDNWFRWVLEEGRTFDRPAAVAARLDWLVSRLPTALDVLAGTVGPSRV